MIRESIHQPERDVLVGLFGHWPKNTVEYVSEAVITPQDYNWKQYCDDLSHDDFRKACFDSDKLSDREKRKYRKMKREGKIFTEDSAYGAMKEWGVCQFDRDRTWEGIRRVQLCYPHRPKFSQDFLRAMEVREAISKTANFVMRIFIEEGLDSMFKLICTANSGTDHYYHDSESGGVVHFDHLMYFTLGDMPRFKFKTTNGVDLETAVANLRNYIGLQWTQCGLPVKNK